MASILKNKIFLFSISLIVLLLLIFILFKKEDKTVFENIYLAGNLIEVEIADNALEYYQGLSNRESLEEGKGMLFVFDDYQKRRFVMRNMNFPLDILFIKDSMVTEVRKNCPPEGSNPEVIYESGAAVNFVLEVPAGYSNKYGIEAGAKFLFK